MRICTCYCYTPYINIYHFFPFFEHNNFIKVHKRCIDSVAFGLQLFINFIYRNNSIYWDTVCLGTPSVLEKIIILTIILTGTY